MQLCDPCLWLSCIALRVRPGVSCCGCIHLPCVRTSVQPSRSHRSSTSPCVRTSSAVLCGSMKAARACGQAWHGCTTERARIEPRDPPPVKESHRRQVRRHSTAQDCAASYRMRHTSASPRPHTSCAYLRAVECPGLRDLEGFRRLGEQRGGQERLEQQGLRHGRRPLVQVRLEPRAISTGQEGETDEGCQRPVLGLLVQAGQGVAVRAAEDLQEQGRVVQLDGDGGGGDALHVIHVRVALEVKAAVEA